MSSVDFGQAAGSSKKCVSSWKGERKCQGVASVEFDKASDEFEEANVEFEKASGKCQVRRGEWRVSTSEESRVQKVEWRV